MILRENLRNWQEEAFESWVNSNKRSIVVASTGSGKTFLGLFCLQEVRESTIIIVPTIVLMNQWKKAVLDNLDVDKKDVGLYYGEKKELKPITIAVVNSIRESDLSLFSMCILDEIHRMGADTNIQPLLRSHFNYTLGITATLKREDKRHEELMKVIGLVSYTYSPIEAKRDKVYNSFNLYNVKVSMTEKEKETYDKSDRIIQMNNGNFAGFGDMVSASKNPRTDRGRQALGLLKNIANRRKTYCNAQAKIPKAVEIIKENDDKRVIIFSEYIAPANEVYNRLLKKGYRIGIYHSKRKKKEDPLEDFRKGKINILVSVKSLNEGLDVEDASVGVIMSSNKVDRNTIQRLGRIVRYKEEKEAKLYQLYCNDTVEQKQVNERMKILQPLCDNCYWI